jgi:hypothetical protein
MFFNGVKVFNNKPRLFVGGGNVVKTGVMTRKQLNNDSVRAILQVGEMVIPKKHAKLVTNFLKKQNIKLPDM